MALQKRDIGRVARVSARFCVLFFAVGLLLVAPSAGAAAATSCSWKVSPSGVKHGTLWGVDGRARNDVWAVGISVGQSLAEHWDGKRWRAVDTPASAGVLLAVAALSPKDAWAVGTDGDRPLIERWNGTRWRTVRAPLIREGVLYGVDAASPNNVWARLAPPS